MKIITIIALILPLVSCALAQGEEPATENIEEKVKTLMANKNAPEAIELLKQALKHDPKSIIANRELGAIYAFVSSEPAQAIPFLEQSWGQGDVKSLVSLGYALMASQNIKKILQYQDAFIENFDDLGGTQVIVFYIAGLKKDRDIFDAALKKVTFEDISQRKSLASMIAKAAKLVSEQK